MDRDRLAWLALMIVDEAAEQTREGPAAPTIGLRLALGYLCSIADGPIFELPTRRYIFDAFWKAATEPDRGNPHAARYARSSMCDSCLQQIARQLGEPATFFNTVRSYRHRRALAQAVHDAGRAPRGKHGGGPNLKRPMDQKDER